MDISGWHYSATTASKTGQLTCTLRVTAPFSVFAEAQTGCGKLLSSRWLLPAPATLLTWAFGPGLRFPHLYTRTTFLLLSSSLDYKDSEDNG